MPDPISAELLADIRHRYENCDTVGLMLDCLRGGINVLDGRSPRGRDIWIAELRQYQADHEALLAEAVRLKARNDALEEAFDIEVNSRLEVEAEVDRLKEAAAQHASDELKTWTRRWQVEWGVERGTRRSVYPYDDERSARAAAAGHEGHVVVRRLVGPRTAAEPTAEGDPA